MKVILQETMDGVGHLGDLLDVKAGYARNFLLPRKKRCWPTVAASRPLSISSA